jgi:hypothetical protein
MAVIESSSVEQLKAEVGEFVTPFFDRYTGLDAEVKKHEARIDDITKEYATKINALRKERDAAIDEVKKEIGGLRDARSYLRTIVRNINPELIPPMHNGNHGKRNGKKKKGGWQKGQKSYGVETIQAATAWVQSRREELNAMNNGEGFRPIDVYSREDWNILKSDSAVGQLIGHLHQGLGVLALNKWVRGKATAGRPTGKFYKVI